MGQTHTPGPWDVGTDANGVFIFSKTALAVVAAIPQDDTPRENDNANAALIAAAPDMLAALKALHACHRAFSGNENWTALDDDARAIAESVIAKAEGV